MSDRDRGLPRGSGRAGRHADRALRAPGEPRSSRGSSAPPTGFNGDAARAARRSRRRRSPSGPRSSGCSRPGRRSTPTRSRALGKVSRGRLPRAQHPRRSSSSTPAPRLTVSSALTPASVARGAHLEARRSSRSRLVCKSTVGEPSSPLSELTASSRGPDANPGEEAMTSTTAECLPVRSAPFLGAQLAALRRRLRFVVVVDRRVRLGWLHAARRPHADSPLAPGEGTGQHPRLAGLRRGRLQRPKTRLGHAVREADRLQGQREVLRHVRRGRQPDEERSITTSCRPPVTRRCA